jgi:hypothetical protein
LNLGNEKMYPGNRKAKVKLRGHFWEVCRSMEIKQRQVRKENEEVKVIALYF